MKKIFTLMLCLMMTASLIGCNNKKEDKAVATVNGKEITLGNYEKLLALNKLSMESYYGSDIWSTKVDGKKTYEDTLRDMVLENMISSEVIYQQAEKDKVAPTDKQVQEQINTFNKQTEKDEKYKKELEKMGIDEDFLKYQFSRDLASSNLQAKFEDDTKVSESEMKKYYEKNKADYYTDTVDASHILLKTIDDKGKELSAEKKKEAKKKAEEALAKIKAGEDFAKVAKEYSQDSTASNGGELGTFGKGQMVPEFEKVAFSMKPGQVSDIVKTQYGYHIIKVTKKVDKQQSFKEVKSQIKSTLLSEKYTKYIEKLKKDSTIEKKEDVVKSAKF
ncbi:peptidylprolyl isomerase [Terrisporobacter sp.]